MLFSKQERDYLQRFNHPKRRKEWIAGRVAAKIALLNQADAEKMRQQSQSLTVLPDEYGRPIAAGQAMKSGLSLSISHSGNYAAALVAHEKNCGVDLQKISDKLPSLTDYFALTSELDMLGRMPEIGSYEIRLTMLWAMKEAVKKSVLSDQPTNFSIIELQQIAAAGNGVWRCDCMAQHRLPQRVFVHDLTPYILALTTA